MKGKRDEEANAEKEDENEKENARKNEKGVSSQTFGTESSPYLV